MSVKNRKKIDRISEPLSNEDKFAEGVKNWLIAKQRKDWSLWKMERRLMAAFNAFNLPEISNFDCKKCPLQVDDFLLYLLELARSAFYTDRPPVATLGICLQLDGFCVDFLRSQCSIAGPPS